MMSQQLPGQTQGADPKLSRIGTPVPMTRSCLGPGLFAAVLLAALPCLVHAAVAWSIGPVESVTSAARLSRVLARQPLAVTFYMSVTVSSDLFTLAPGGQAEFPLPDGATAELVAERIIRHRNGLVTFVGHVVNDVDATSVITRSPDGEVQGTLSDGLDVYVVRALGQDQAEVMDYSRVMPPSLRGDVVEPPIPSSAPASEELQPMMRAMNGSAPESRGTTPVALRVFVGYTPAEAKTYGAGLQTYIQNQVDGADAIYQASNTSVDIALAGTTELSNGDGLDDLAWLSDDEPRGSSGAVNEDLRLGNNAQLFVMMQPYIQGEPYCGVSGQEGGTGAGGSPQGSNPEYYLSQYGYIIAESGSGCDLNSLTLAHEIGHQLGAGHDAYVSYDPNDSAAYTWAHGYDFTVAPTNYGTVMSVSPVTRVGFLSSPKLNCEGVVCGDATHNNAQAIVQDAPVVADYIQGSLSVVNVSSVGVNCGSTGQITQGCPIEISYSTQNEVGGTLGVDLESGGNKVTTIASGMPVNGVGSLEITVPMTVLPGTYSVEIYSEVDPQVAAVSAPVQILSGAPQRPNIAAENVGLTDALLQVNPGAIEDQLQITVTVVNLATGKTVFTSNPENVQDVLVSNLACNTTYDVTADVSNALGSATADGSFTTALCNTVMPAVTNATIQSAGNGVITASVTTTVPGQNLGVAGMILGPDANGGFEADDVPVNAGTTTTDLPKVVVPCGTTRAVFFVELQNTDGLAFSQPVTVTQPTCGGDVIGFTSAATAATYAPGTLELSVSRSSAEGVTSVNYTTEDGTAKSGTDYGSTSGTLVFPYGVTIENFTVDIPGGAPSSSDGPLSFTVSLSNPSDGASLDANASVNTVTLTVPTDSLPVAEKGSVNVQAGATVTGTLTGSGQDPLTYAIVQYPSQGIVELTDPNSGAFTYTAANGDSGTASFTFTVSNSYGTSSAATETVTIAAAPSPAPASQGSGSSSGGGGAFSWVALAFLALCLTAATSSRWVRRFLRSAVRNSDVHGALR